jgi:hypothetical protein
MEQQFPLKYWYRSTKLHGLTSQMIPTVVRTANQTLHCIFLKAFLNLQFTGLDIADISLPLQSIGMELCTHKSGNSVMLMRTFIEGIQDVIDVSPSLQLSEYSLLGEFMKCLLLKLIEDRLTKVTNCHNPDFL